jgi:hypothetical protein
MWKQDANEAAGLAYLEINDLQGQIRGFVSKRERDFLCCFLSSTISNELARIAGLHIATCGEVFAECKAYPRMQTCTGWTTLVRSIGKDRCFLDVVLQFVYSSHRSERHLA